MRMALGAAYLVARMMSIAKTPAPPGTRATRLKHHYRSILVYLSPLMEANAAMVGEQVIKFQQRDQGTPIKPKRSPISVAAPLLGQLRRMGFVTYLRDLHAWRITAAGRAALKDAE